MSLPDLLWAQYSSGLDRFGEELDRARPPSFSSVDSFGSPITVFNMTTISPPLDYIETATKVTAETIDALLGAIDNAAQTIEDAQVSTADAWTPTTQRVPVTPDEGFTLVPPHFGGGHGGVDGEDDKGSLKGDDDNEEVAPSPVERAPSPPPAPAKVIRQLPT